MGVIATAFPVFQLGGAISRVGEDRPRCQAYGPKRYDRLKALKRKYDRDNIFRINQNISPN